METDKADPPTYSSFSGDEFSGFREYSMVEIRGVLIRSPAKTCSLDPISTDVLLESIDILLPFICLMCNSSLSEGCLPGSQKAAIITPLLKKSNLGQYDAKNYRPISNLTFISKVIERIVAEQLKKHLVDSNSMPPLQSEYRYGTCVQRRVAILWSLEHVQNWANGVSVYPHRRCWTRSLIRSSILLQAANIFGKNWKHICLGKPTHQPLKTIEKWTYLLRIQKFS